MKSYLNFGLALLFTIIALVVFAYCSFIGLDFRLHGNLVLAAIVYVPVLILLAYSLKTMIVSKAKRNAREGRPRELRSLFVAFAILAIGAVPCSKFLEIYRQQDQLTESVKEAVIAVSELDSAYLEYAHERIMGVKDRRVRSSLQRRLIPESYDQVAAQRRQWLASLGEANIWNLYTATNVNKLQEAAETWNTEDSLMSSVIYVCEGQEVRPFSHTASAEKLAAFNSSFTEFHAPESKAVMGTLMCILFVLMCYIFTERPKTAREL